ncbi:hypothetical protein WISP_112679 [Willisornis vidua]|uniref:Uncharacterized protein n=1 Tax=Willisornis vidua TaxID=1566151 RepID=A0ABQ9D0X5_9PASS|nr:hypothetical protein WISP_112679 [Willisornis vidua]
MVDPGWIDGHSSVHGKMDAIHKLKVLVMFLSLATFMVMVIMNAGNATGIFKGLFRTTPGNISDKYSTDFTPAGWTFLIWNVIYAWQLAWLLYALSGICRRYLLPALVFLAVLTLTTCASLFISHRALSTHSSWFVKGHKAELWLIRILVQNGLALYGAWTTIATLLNFAIVLIYQWNVSHEKATTASLSILALSLVVWFYLENFFLDKYVRYNLTIYPVVITALIGSACKNNSFSSPMTNNIFIGVPEGHVLFPVWLVFSLHLKQKSVVVAVATKKEKNNNSNEKKKMSAGPGAKEWRNMVHQGEVEFQPLSILHNFYY